MLVLWTVILSALEIVPFGPMTLCTNDSFAQYMPFLSDLWDTLHLKHGFFYSFNGGLGVDFFSTAAYYLISPVNLLILLFDKADIPAAASWIVIIKSMCCASAMAWYLARRSRKRTGVLYAVLLSFVYGFSGYFAAYACNFMWIDAIALVPLMMDGLEHMLQRRGRLLYCCSLSMAMITNFYMGAVICVFLFLYEITVCLPQSRQKKRQAALFAACSLCAALLACCILLPSGLSLLSDNVSRMQLPDFESFHQTSYLALRALPGADVIKIASDRGTVNLYMGSGLLLLSFLYARIPSVPASGKIGMLGLLVFVLFATQISLANFMLHGFYLQRLVPNRFAFLIPLLCCVMAFTVLDSGISLSTGEMAVCALLCAAFYSSCLLEECTENTWQGLSYMLVMLALWMLALSRKSNPLIVLALCIEAAQGMCMVTPADLSASYEQMESYIEAGSLKGNGRQEILSGSVTNAPALYGYQGMSTFNSVINSSTSSILGRLGFAQGENYYRHIGYTAPTDLLLGIDTLYSQYDEPIPYPYRFAGKTGNVRVYKSPCVLGKAVEIDFERLEPHYVNKFDNINNLFDMDLFEGVYIQSRTEGVKTEKEDNSNYTVPSLRDEESLRIILEPFEARSAYIYARLSADASMTVRINDTIRSSTSYAGYITYLGDVGAEDTVQIEFRCQEDKENAELNVFVSTLSDQAYDSLWESLKARTWSGETIGANRISGDYSCDEEADLVVTIPYDPNWTATVNGQPVSLDHFARAFPVLHLKAGNNHIELVYSPRGLKEGCMLSGAGVFVCLALCMPQKRNRRQKPSERRRKSPSDI